MDADTKGLPSEGESGSAPRLTRIQRDGVAWWGDSSLGHRNVLVAFSERGGGDSVPPYESLNLASHVGDDPATVDANRTRFIEAVGLGRWRDNLVTAEQVHGDSVAVIDASQAGSGAFASAGRPPIPATDALVACERGTPLMLFYADCVPVVLVAPGPCVAVVHAGWRGALSGIAGSAAECLARIAVCPTVDLSCYVGAHVGGCHYEVGDGIMSHFVNMFGTFARAESGGLDLGFVVAESLVSVGVDPCRIASLGICTAEATDRFYSYRAQQGPTGRHCALACIL